MNHHIPDTECRLGNKHPKGHTLIELTVSMGILAVVVSCFSAVLNSTQKMEQAYARESCAIVILNNMVERLTIEKTWNHNTAQVILKQEFQASQLSQHSRLTPQCNLKDHIIHAAIIKPNGKALAQVEIRQ